MSWLGHQKLEPKCIAVDIRCSSDVKSSRYEYVFENEGYVMRQYFGRNERVTIEDYYNDEVLATSEKIYDYDNVRCAEKMYETARGSEYVSKEVVDSIIYKLMIGDLKLIRE